MVDLWETSSTEVRERWRTMARIIKDAADDIDHLAECLQLLFLGAAVSGYCGRGTGGEASIRSFLPERTADCVLGQGFDPSLGLASPDPEYLRKHLRPEFPMTPGRARRIETAAKKLRESTGSPVDNDRQGRPPIV